MIPRCCLPSMGVTEQCKVGSIPFVWFLVIYLQLQRSSLSHKSKYCITTHPIKSFPADGLGIFHSSKNAVSGWNVATSNTYTYSFRKMLISFPVAVFAVEV